MKYTCGVCETELSPDNIGGHWCYKLEEYQKKSAERHQKKSAERYNAGKPKFSLIDLTCLTECALVLEFGAKKYSRDGWRKGFPQTEVIDSLLRHISAIQRGELIDPESGLSHLGHIQCNAMFLGNKENT